MSSPSTDRPAEATHYWLPSTVREMGNHLDSVTEQVIVLANAYDLAVRDHQRLLKWLVFLGCALMATAIASLTLSPLVLDATTVHEIIALDIPVLYAYLVFSLVLTSAACTAIIYACFIHKPLNVVSLRKVWWMVYGLSDQSGTLLFDASDIAPMTQVRFSDVSHVHLERLVEGLQATKTGLDGERKLVSTLDELSTLPETKESQEFSTTALEQNGVFTRAVLDLLAYLEQGQPLPGELSQPPTSRNGAYLQRELIESAREDSARFLEAIRTARSELDKSVTPFATNLEWSIEAVGRHFTKIQSDLNDRWFGNIQVTAEPTTLSTLTHEYPVSQDTLNKIGYTISPYTVKLLTGRDRSSSLHTLQSAIDRLEVSAGNSVTDEETTLRRALANRLKQVESSQQSLRDEYNLKIHRLEQEARIHEVEANGYKDMSQDISIQLRRSRDELSRIGDDISSARLSGSVAHLRAAHNDNLTVQSRVVLLEDELSKVSQERTSHQQNAKILRNQASLEKVELENRVQALQSEVEREIETDIQSASDNIQSIRRPLDNLYKLRDEELLALKRVLDVIVNREPELHLESFTARAEHLESAKAQAVSQVEALREERQAILAQIEDFALPNIIEHDSIVIYIPFWLAELEAKRGTKTVALPPLIISRKRDPPKVRRMYEVLTFPSSPELQCVSQAVSDRSEVFATYRPLRFDSINVKRWADEIDQLVLEDTITLPYASRLKDHYGLAGC